MTDTPEVIVRNNIDWLIDELKKEGNQKEQLLMRAGLEIAREVAVAIIKIAESQENIARYEQWLYELRARR